MLSRQASTHPQSSPGLFVTPNTPQRNRPLASSPSRAPQSHGKRPRDEAEDLDPATRRAQWQRMMERMRNHEKQMEQTRDQLEKTNQMLAEQQRRIDELEHQRRIDELQQELDQQVSAENEQAHAGKDVLLRREAGLQPNEDVVQRAGQQEQRRRHGKQRQQDPHLQAEQPEARQREPETNGHSSQHAGGYQLANRQRQRHAEPRSPAELDGHIDAEVQPSPAPDLQRHSQRRLKRKVLGHPLSGHNPKLIFDDDDRPIVSEATVFLLRLSQQEVLDKFSRYIKHKSFFDVHHPDFKSMGCWIISAKATSDYRMKLRDRGEQHTFSFRRLAIRLWHDEVSIYSLLQGKNHQKAIQVCQNEQCMHPGHIQVESSKESAERRKCKQRRRCAGHVTTHKDGTVQRRRLCIFAPLSAE
ncbi:hypothetical protein SLS53_006895 [Cytospora paraplurivora]|uniref:Zinc-binding loop region of homing endonuclease domain-containing protein n=1 Tax=Cytospora paraplurivora TaxID=2898453 RepID=A0AAN9U980_9PEZI